MVLFEPRYRGLIDDIFRANRLADDFSLYLTPRASPTTRSPRRTSADYVLSPVPHLGLAPLDWAVGGPRYGDRILKYLNDRHIPGRTTIWSPCGAHPFDFRDELNFAPLWVGASSRADPHQTPGLAA
ncbi:MAG: hypothetical protein IPK28_18830 [Devosia sp.]|nr:hypothetical protein [Devosia sp.]